jgi:hypothetical protein
VRERSSVNNTLMYTARDTHSRDVALKLRKRLLEETLFVVCDLAKGMNLLHTVGLDRLRQLGTTFT